MKKLFNNQAIKNLATGDKPREKMISQGSGSLSDSELIAILVNSGNREKSAIELAREILLLGKNNLNELGKLSIKDLQQIKGIGHTKAIAIAAALEIGRRRQLTVPLEKLFIGNSSTIATFLQATLKDFNYEVFAVIFLNRANKIKHFEIVSRGGITGTVADPRLILRKAIEEQATSIILSHNHPSGNLQPSKADEEITNKIKQAAAYLDIKVLDHIIVSDDGYFSFADEGMI